MNINMSRNIPCISVLINAKLRIYNGFLLMVILKIAVFAYKFRQINNLFAAVKIKIRYFCRNKTTKNPRL